MQAANSRLRRGNIGATIKLRGGRLSLIATLPPKPGSRWIKPHRQVISTGIRANKVGVKYVEAEARLLGARLASNTFDWDLYDKRGSRGDVLIVRDAIASFKAHYEETHSLRASTWKNQWAKVFKYLPQDAPLTDELLIKETLAKARDTRLRLETARKLQHLADFHKIEVDLLQYKGGYGASKVQARQLPSDEEIASWYYRIPNRRWQWVYGILAATGMRPHEAFFCDWQDGKLEIRQGKTGARTVLEFFYPEWIDEWNLREIRLPAINAQSAYENNTLGAKVTRQFKRYGVPFEAYELRHAAAVRMSVVFGLQMTVAARIMGHSVQEHTRTYHRHLNRAEEERAIARVMDASDRPKPPVIPAAPAP